jgi:hypothetical protein
MQAKTRIKIEYYFIDSNCRVYVIEKAGDIKIQLYA